MERETSSAPTSAEAEAAAATSVMSASWRVSNMIEPGCDDGHQRQPRRQQGQTRQTQAELRQQPEGETAEDARRQAAERECERKRRHQVTKR